jgi:hypothetical protein
MNKTEIRKFKSLLRQGSSRHMNITLNDIFQKELLNIIKDYEKLQIENQELKKQLEEYQLQNIDLRADIMIQKMAFPNKLIKDKTFYDLYNMPTYEELLVQQKEFIKYLEDTIQKEQKNLDDLCDIYKVPKENNSTYKFLCSFVHRIEEILSKYKEIIGVLNEKDM